MASSVTRGRGVCRAAAVLSYCAAFFVAAVVYVSMGASAQIPFNADGYTILRRGSGAAALKVSSTLVASMVSVLSPEICSPVVRAVSVLSIFW